jgi:hypothetical protein
MINCDFSEPVNLGQFPEKPDWEFSKISCSGELDVSSSSIPLYISKIISPDNSRSFYLNKSLSYGDILILFFIVFFLVFGIIGVIRKLITEKFLTRRLF